MGQICNDRPFLLSAELWQLDRIEGVVARDPGAAIMAKRAGIH